MFRCVHTSFIQPLCAGHVRRSIYNVYVKVGILDTNNFSKKQISQQHFVSLRVKKGLVIIKKKIIIFRIFKNYSVCSNEKLLLPP